MLSLRDRTRQQQSGKTLTDARVACQASKMPECSQTKASQGIEPCHVHEHLCAPTTLCIRSQSGWISMSHIQTKYSSFFRQSRKTNPAGTQTHYQTVTRLYSEGPLVRRAIISPNYIVVYVRLRAEGSGVSNSNC